MLTLTVTIDGHTLDDITLALHELTAKVEYGYTSGADSNATGAYSFDLAGEEEDVPSTTNSEQ